MDGYFSDVVCIGCGCLNGCPARSKERGSRKSGKVDTEKLTDFWNHNPARTAFRKTAPNAVIFSVFPNQTADMIAPISIELSHPQYNVETQTLTYQVKFLNKADQPISSKIFGKIAVYIDPGIWNCSTYNAC